MLLTIGYLDVCFYIASRKADQNTQVREDTAVTVALQSSKSLAWILFYIELKGIREA
jgi:hypothetical protein